MASNSVRESDSETVEISPPNLWWLSILAALLVAATAYAQFQIERYTAGKGKSWLTRALLLAVGIALGYVMWKSEGPLHGPSGLLLFLIGLGLVHLPASFILFIKQLRGSGGS